ncbi:MAG: methyl-accepting chemotaxis protein, partial [Candidatus Tectomicrobia bacterium]|nr:methyl-accepting chemotaxis protein [Candidatus Tectomicrobia bacterium]
MKWFLNMSTRGKLVVGFGMMVLLLVIVSSASYVAVTGMRSSLENLYRLDLANVHDLKDIRANQNGIRAEVLEMLSRPRGAAFDDSHQEIKERHKENSEKIPKLLDRNKHIPSLLAKLNEFVSVQKEFSETRDAKIIPLLYEGKSEDARQLMLGIQDQQNRKMRAIVGQMTNEVEAQARVAVAQAEERADQAIRLILIFGLAAVVAAVLAVGGMGRVIANPLKEISGVAERLAAGDLTVGVSADGRADEVGVLQQTFRKMVENLRQSTRDLQEGVNVLGSSAGEILAGTTQVASGAAETATAVAETTSTVEELK